LQSYWDVEDVAVVAHEHGCDNICIMGGYLSWMLLAVIYVSSGGKFVDHEHNGAAQN